MSESTARSCAQAAMMRASFAASHGIYGAPRVFLDLREAVRRRSASGIVVLLPARSYVAHESVLRRAISQTLSELPRIPEGVATLGMLDMQDPVDEDYLIVGAPPDGAGLEVRGIARRPMPAVVGQSA